MAARLYLQLSRPEPLRARRSSLARAPDRRTAPVTRRRWPGRRRTERLGNRNGNGAPSMLTLKRLVRHPRSRLLATLDERGCGSRSPQHGGGHACHLGVGPLLPNLFLAQATPRLMLYAHLSGKRAEGSALPTVGGPLRRARNEDRWPPRTVSHRSSLALEDAAATKTLRSAGLRLTVREQKTGPAGSPNHQAAPTPFLPPRCQRVPRGSRGGASVPPRRLNPRLPHRCSPARTRPLAAITATR